MTCTTDRPRRSGLILAIAALLAVTGPAGADGDAASGLVREAHVALARGDGIAAEVALRKAQAAGLPRRAVAARMGEALLDQGELVKARSWLGPADFTPAEAPHGWRMLGRLEMAQGHLATAGHAFDKALALSPDDSRLWVDIARLRYRGGEQLQAVVAADKAVRLDPNNVRALELRGLMIRDSFGFKAALPWFEAGLMRRPEDLALLGEYAATLGELGRAREMLTVTRRMIALDDHNALAFYLQATLAARSGNVPLARALLERAGQSVLQTPSGLLLSGVLELEAGNTNLAVELLDRLVRLQPDNAAARLLLARAMAAAGSDEELIERFAAEAAAPGASPYLRIIVARSYENRGARDLAAPLLDAAARAVPPATMLPVAVTADATPPALAAARARFAANDSASAQTLADRIAADMPGAATSSTLAGDARFARGDVAGALARYRRAMDVRLTDPLFLRIVASHLRLKDANAARQFVAQVRSERPRNLLAIRLEARLAAHSGKWREAAERLDYLAGHGLARDALLQADRAEALEHSGREPIARQAMVMARALQPEAGSTPQRH